MEILFKIKTKQTENKQLLSLPNKPTNKNNQPNIQQPKNSIGFLIMEACLSDYCCSLRKTIPSQILLQCQKMFHNMEVEFL